MTALASRLVTAKFPAAPAGGTLGPGNYIEFRLSQPAWNLTTGEEVPMLLQGPIDPVTGAMGFWDTTVATPQAGVRLVCNDDPSISPQGTVWTATSYVENMPGTPIPLVVSVGDTDPVFLATLARPTNSSVSYGIQFDDGTTTLPNVTRVTVTNGTLSGTGNHATVATGGGSGGGSGTVTSVAQTVPPEFAVSGSPITTAGTLAITKANQAANQVWAGPTTGAAAAPAFRALVAADLPAATTGAQGAAVLATPSSDVTAGHVVQASDARLSDSRAPTGTAGGDLGGTYPNPAVAGVAAGRVDITEIAAPANPAAGKLRLYAKTDDTLHVLSSAGVDTALGAGGGGASFPLQSPFPGGNARGTGATDLQTAHSANNMVASGTDATIGGGQDNIASGNWAVVAGGRTNTAAGRDPVIGGGIGNTTSGNEPTIAGGNGNLASGDNSFIGGGQANTASGAGSTVPGGFNNTASGIDTRASGTFAVASLFGQDAYAAFGLGGVPGASQRSDCVLGAATTDATATELFLDGSAARLTLAANRASTYQLLVIARQDTGAGVAGWKAEGVMNRITGGNITLSGNSVTAIGTPPAGWAVTVTADTTNQSLKITVTGAAATNVHWLCRVLLSEVV